MTRQQEINGLISAFGVKKSFLARKLGVSRQVLSYQLNVAEDLDHDYYTEILAILNSMKNGLLQEEGGRKQAAYTSDDTQNFVREPRRFRIEATVPAGLAEMTSYDDWFESDVLDYYPDDHVFLRIDEEFGH